MKKRRFLKTIILSMVIIGGLTVSNVIKENKDLYTYEVTSVNKFVIGKATNKISDNNQGIFLEITDKTRNYNVGDIIKVKYDENNNIINLK